LCSIYKDKYKDKNIDFSDPLVLTHGRHGLTVESACIQVSLLLVVGVEHSSRYPQFCIIYKDKNINFSDPLVLTHGRHGLTVEPACIQVWRLLLVVVVEVILFSLSVVVYDL